MKWLVVIVIVATVSLKSAFAQLLPPPPGTCASIGYADRCCPPGGSCTASDGTCKCDTLCRQRNDCCADIFCAPIPTTCQQMGITQCCTDANPVNCRVKNPQTVFDLGGVTHYTSYATICSCDPGCHDRAQPNNCCPDAVQIGCAPQNCSHVGLQPGCCEWSASSICHVGGGDCYCDSYCVVFNDCCDDVRIPSCNGRAASARKQFNGYSNLETELMTMHAQKYSVQQSKVGVPNPVGPNQGGPYQRRPAPVPGGPSSPQADGQEHHRLALASRLERARVNAREFRGRARAMQRPNYYNYYNGY